MGPNECQQCLVIAHWLRIKTVHQMIKLFLIKNTKEIKSWIFPIFVAHL